MLRRVRSASDRITDAYPLGMLLNEVVRTSTDVAAESGRKAKWLRIGELLAAAGSETAPLIVGFLTGDLPQGKVGVGYAALRDLPSGDADVPTLTVDEINEMVDEVADTTGPGSKARRSEIMGAVFDRATSEERDFLARLLIGDMQQGALDGVMVEAIASAAEVPSKVVRRAHMLRGDLREVAAIALGEGRVGLEAVGLVVLQGIQPMLAQSAESVGEAFERARGENGEVAIEWKLDGARIQIHKAGDVVTAYTRNLNEMTSRVPDVVEIVRSLPADSLILDGEVLRLRSDGSPLPFQDTMSQFGSDAENQAPVSMTPFFFDIIHRDGVDLIDEPASVRFAALDEIVPEQFRAPRLLASAADQAQTFFDEAVGRGHEGTMVKALHAPYAAGRRGIGWIKVKPVHTLDLVILAAEWGHGRRTGYLSNLHLGARDGDGFVMLGKTFKGLTDEMLAWQTEALKELAIPESATDWVDPRGDWVHYVRPELVVEIALDGVQESTRYPGGVALRFARVKGYRPDKGPKDVDTLETVRALFERGRE